MITYFKRIPLKEGIAFYFKFKSFNKEYEQRIELSEKELIKWQCTCKFGSFYGHSKKNKNKKCRHIKECIKLIQELNYYKEE